MLKLSDRYKLNGSFLFEPSKTDLQVIAVESEDSGTDVLGNTHVKILGYKRIVTLTWDIALGKEIAEILALLLIGSATHKLQYVDSYLGVNEIVARCEVSATHTLDHRISTASEGGIIEGFSLEFVGTQITMF